MLMSRLWWMVFFLSLKSLRNEVLLKVKTLAYSMKMVILKLLILTWENHMILLMAEER